ncbi:hypothetical protein [Fodinicola acaciae]|uniref:hypothetical protein n=1 Tax=Fodinicola acaciae TaxID=2681555 RepID=UPI0013D28848|nr:hypothetical protein [Fodinicola acaciae]
MIKPAKLVVPAVIAVLVLTIAYFSGALVHSAIERPSDIVRAVPEPSMSPSPPFVGYTPTNKPAKWTPPARLQPLVGPVFPDNAKVGVRNDLNLPFAFKLPGGWVCVPLTTDASYGVRADCVNSGATTFTIQLRIMARDCVNGCGTAVRDQLARHGWPAAWAPPAGVSWTVADMAAQYAQVTAAARYHLWVSLIARANNDKARMQVAVAIDGPVADTVLMQQIVNDIRMQAQR